MINIVNPIALFCIYPAAEFEPYLIGYAKHSQIQHLSNLYLVIGLNLLLLVLSLHIIRRVYRMDKFYIYSTILLFITDHIVTIMR
jgi:hypothetical protein